MTDKMSASVSADAAISKDQLLSLKVMRMSRPAFNEPVCMGIDPADPFSKGIEKAMIGVNGCESMELPLGYYLMAPQSIDNIYLGETFTFYVVVLNESDQICTDVAIKADLQTQTQRINLQPKLGDSNVELAPGKSFGQMVTHEIKETGQHILVCAVNYRTPDGEKMYFRKFFKFPVNKPIDVRTKFYNAEDNLNNDVYLEAQIQNLCTSAIVLEKVVMEPSEGYSCKEIKPSMMGEEESGNVYLYPKAVRQYLFCLSPVIFDSSLTNYRGVSSIGKLDMVWRSGMGERGRLQTSSLQRMAPGYGDLRCSIEQIPGVIKILQPFVVICRLHNCCERSLDLVLSFDGFFQAGVVICTTSGQHLGQVAPGKSVQFNLTLFATTTGMHSISGIRVMDTFLRRTTFTSRIFLPKKSWYDKTFKLPTKKLKHRLDIPKRDSYHIDTTEEEYERKQPEGNFEGEKFHWWNMNGNNRHPKGFRHKVLQYPVPKHDKTRRRPSVKYGVPCNDGYLEEFKKCFVEYLDNFDIVTTQNKIPSIIEITDKISKIDDYEENKISYNDFQICFKNVPDTCFESKNSKKIILNPEESDIFSAFFTSIDFVFKKEKNEVILSCFLENLVSLPSIDETDEEEEKISKCREGILEIQRVKHKFRENCLDLDTVDEGLEENSGTIKRKVKHNSDTVERDIEKWFIPFIKRHSIGEFCPRLMLERKVFPF